MSSTYIATTPMTMGNNNLPHHQRLRLMRSARKLGAVLGTTPQVENVPDVPSMQARAPRRMGRVFTEADRDSISSLEDLYQQQQEPPMTLTLAVANDSSPVNTKAKAALTRPLVLRLQTLPAGPGAHKTRRSSVSTITAASTPLSPTFVNSSIPTSFSSYTAPTQTVDYRRRKMAKLARTLGENVPPELVFSGMTPSKFMGETNKESSAPAMTRKESRTQRRRSWSVDAPPPPPPAFTIPRRSNDSGNRVSSLAFANLARTGNDTQIGVAISRTTSSTGSFDTMSNVSFQSYDPEADAELKKKTHSRRFPSSSSSISLMRLSNSRTRRERDGGCGRRKEREWSGEWNQMDMSEVVKGLRGLKA